MCIDTDIFVLFFFPRNILTHFFLVNLLFCVAYSNIAYFIGSNASVNWMSVRFFETACSYNEQLNSNLTKKMSANDTLGYLFMKYPSNMYKHVFIFV